MLYRLAVSIQSLAIHKQYILWELIDNSKVTFPIHSLHAIKLPEISEYSFHTALQLSGSIAVCPRGTCEFSVKAEVAESAGAAALLLINDNPGYNLVSYIYCFIQYFS